MTNAEVPNTNVGDMISRQVAIDAFKPYADYESNRTHSEWVRRITLVLEDLPSAQQWIPCSERLPKKERRSYWICTDGGYQYECRWTNVNPFWTDLTTEWHWNIFDIPQYSKVLAWMPLPEPYRRENHETD